MTDLPCWTQMCRQDWPRGRTCHSLIQGPTAYCTCSCSAQDPATHRRYYRHPTYPTQHHRQSSLKSVQYTYCPSHCSLSSHHHKMPSLQCLTSSHQTRRQGSRCLPLWRQTLKYQSTWLANRHNQCIKLHLRDIKHRELLIGLRWSCHMSKHLFWGKSALWACPKCPIPTVSYLHHKNPTLSTAPTS